MSIDLAGRLQQKGLSDRSAGQRVLASWKKLEPRSSLPQAPSIAAKLGELRRGKSTWWGRHPGALEALARLLDCDRADLLGSSQPKPDDIAFIELPELPPLQTTEEPCALGAHGWLATHAFHALGQGVHAWVMAAAGAGKTLTVRFLQRRFTQELQAFSARTLAEAASRAEDALPLIVEVELTDPTTDATALAELSARRTNTCVLAPFARRAIGAEADRRWQDGPWSPPEGWRERLIRWAHTRLPESARLDVPALLEWLEDIDPASALFSTPGELLPVVAWCYRKAAPPTQKTKLEALADEHFTRMFDAAGARYPWLRREGRSTVHALVRRRVEAVDLPKEPLPFDAWAALLLTDAAPGIGDDEARRQVDAVARERSGKVRRKKAEEAIAVLAVSRPREAVHLLLEQGVLRAQPNGQLDVYPTWALRALERRIVAERIRQADIRIWGLWAADASRRSLVDEALDALTPARLVAAAAHVLQEPGNELAIVAAIEALFAACGRRMLREWKPTPEHVPTLQALGQRQTELLCWAGGVDSITPPLPLTRRPGEFAWAPLQLWMFEAWAFSLRVPRPSAIPAEVSWRLPGWADNLRLADAPEDLGFPGMYASWDGRSPDGVRSLEDLFTIVREVLRCCTDEDSPERVPLVFLPWLALDGPSRGWKPKLAHCTAVIPHPMGTILATLLEAETPEIRSPIVADIWPAITARADGDPLVGMIRLRHDNPTFFAVVAAYLPRELFDADLVHAKLDRNVVERLGELPCDLRRSVLRVIASRIETTTSVTFWGLEPFMEVLDADDLDLLVEFASDRYQLGKIAAQRVFALDPERALVEVRAALGKMAPSASVWFFAAPRTHWRSLLDLLEIYGVGQVSWGARWIAKMLPLAGTEAPRMFRLLQPAEPRRPPHGGSPQ